MMIKSKVLNENSDKEEMPNLNDPEIVAASLKI